MDIKFTGKYKSLTSFEWKNIPNLVVITGPNGAGKSQLLSLIHSKLTGIQNVDGALTISEKEFKPEEITFLRGEWTLNHPGQLTLHGLHQQMEQYYSQYQGNHLNGGDIGQIRMRAAFDEIDRKLGKAKERGHSMPFGNKRNKVSREEFFKHFPEIILEHEGMLSTKIAEIFYNYRINEIDLLSQRETDEDIKSKLGQKPWDVLREIIKEAKLPFDINDPSTIGIKDAYQLKLTHQILKEQIYFHDLSSGERVLFSLVFYLYNSQEKGLFPKLLLMDEPDAHLHPSMSQQFINVIKNVLVDKYGVQVIMTTHSPSTVILAPFESIYEMSRTEPRIRKSPSKNHAVSLLTAGLVYVGEGTKYFLVEDKDDADFYTYVHERLTAENLIDTNIPLIFIPASTKDKSGGKDAVQNWVSKLQGSGLVNVIHGLIDNDSGNVVSDGVFKLDRYSIENYLIDPILVYAALIDKEKNPEIPGLILSLGEEYKLKSLSGELLQQVADSIFAMVEPELNKYFADFDDKEKERVAIAFTNGVTLQYPKWFFVRRGKTILQQAYTAVFTGQVANIATLSKALKKLNMFPLDLVKKMDEMKKTTTMAAAQTVIEN